jgi:hypothetical protein
MSRKIPAMLLSTLGLTLAEAQFGSPSTLRGWDEAACLGGQTNKHFRVVAASQLDCNY